MTELWNVDWEADGYDGDWEENANETSDKAQEDFGEGGEDDDWEDDDDWKIVDWEHERNFRLATLTKQIDVCYNKRVIGFLGVG